MTTTTGRRILCSLAFFLATTLGACVVSRPPQNVGFSRARTLQDFTGAYVNKGEAKTAAASIYLSSIIWPSEKDLGHENIATIDVHAAGDTALIVRALGSQGDTVRTSSFTKGTQFEIREGRLRLKRSAQAVAPNEDGAAFLGVGSETVDLGIDAGGDAKYKSTISFAGVAFLVVPIAGGGVTEVRFRKLHQ